MFEPRSRGIGARKEAVMRIRSLVLAVATALAIAAPATAAGPFSTGYLWAQPKVAITANPFAALPLWLTLK